MDRTYVICHMLQSMDGRIAGRFFCQKVTQELVNVYRQKGECFGADAIIYGSTTAKEIFIDDFTSSNLPECQVNRYEDFICMNDKRKWVVVIDPLGSLDWNEDALKNARLKDRNVIEVLSENVTPQYMTLLRHLGVSYIFAGKDELNMEIVLQKLKNLFHIEKTLLQGGAIVNQSFVNENLVDEISLIISPIIEGNSDMPASFESKEVLESRTHYTIVETEILSYSGLWLHYVKDKEYGK